MARHPFRFSFLFVLSYAAGFGFPVSGLSIDPSKLPPAASVADFQRDIRPILENECVSCHGAGKQKGGFRIDSREGMMKGGDNGAAIVEKKSADSILIHYVARLVEDMEMPPKKERSLSPAQVGLLRAWIDSGAAWPVGMTLTAADGEGNDKPAAAKLASLLPAASRKVEFVKDIQPIFQGACYECHGPRKQEAGFRLDHKPTALKGGELGPAIAPGKSAESLLIHFVAGLREEGVMPKKGDRLSAEQIGLLRAWIDQGAEWPESASVALKDNTDHWAFKAPSSPAVPQTRDTAWPRTDLDRFVLARLEKEGLTPSAEVSKAALLRRVSLDLIGLPPTVEELDAFLSDQSPSAYQRQVERLLASPHYGEKWGRHWLDVARYADSDGYEKDKPRIAWFYRDWVVNALNRDLPYNRFIIEQIAGDQLPNASQDQIVATGFLRNSMINEEGGVDPEQFRMEAMFDRMDAIGKGVLGLTIQCAQCHTHKYDPITHEEYYKLFAYLNNDHEAQPVVYTAQEQIKRAEVLRQIGEIEGKLRHETPDWQEKMTRWEESLKSDFELEWTTIQPVVEDISTGGQRYLPQKDGSFLAAGFQPTKHEVKMHLKTPIANIAAFRIELMKDAELPAEGPGRSHFGTFALTEFSVDAGPGDGSGKKQAVKFTKAISDLEPPAETTIHPNFNEKQPVKRVIGPASYAIDGKGDTAWSNDIGPGRRNVDCYAIFIPEQPIAHASGSDLTIKLSQKHGGWNADDLHSNNLGRFRISVAAAKPSADVALPREVREALRVPRDKRSPAEIAAIFRHWRSSVPEWKEANARIEALWKQYPEGTTQLVLTPRIEMRDTRMLKRGDWLKPGKPVIAGVPAVLHQPPADAPPTRLTFANWLVDDKSPTTARVLVNRVWQSYFGIGIVGTSEDFGVQSETPSHPELLDWLATEFMRNGWSLKQLHRTIVHSATYRQSSRITPELYERDQFNRLLARGPRLRVEGEIVRDIQLATSGLLTRKLGGKPVMPPAPAFLFLPPASYAPFPWVAESGPDRYRRALYTYRRRTTPYPMLAAFDVPEGNVSCVRRATSNTPMQALMTLNETVSMEAAQALARKLLEQPVKTDVERIDYGFRRVLSRRPTEAERDVVLGLLEKQRAYLAEGWVNSWELATGKQVKPSTPDGISPTQLAAYTVISRVLLNLDEAITKE